MNLEQIINDQKQEAEEVINKKIHKLQAKHQSFNEFLDEVFAGWVAMSDQDIAEYMVKESVAEDEKVIHTITDRDLQGAIAYNFKMSAQIKKEATALKKQTLSLQLQSLSLQELKPIRKQLNDFIRKASLLKDLIWMMIRKDLPDSVPNHDNIGLRENWQVVECSPSHHISVIEKDLMDALDTLFSK
jgi:hypothetical protein